MADIANTKAADAAKSPMPPPPATPASSGKKRKRSEAAKVRDKLVTSKRCQTYKLFEALQQCRVIDDPSELEKLKKFLRESAVLALEEYEEIRKEWKGQYEKKVAQAIEAYEMTQRHKKEFEEATERAEKKSQQQFIEFLKWQGEYKSIKCDVMQQKLGLMEDREELQKKIQEQKQLQQKFDELHAEVKELRKLKYAADRKAKGPVGVVR